MLISLTNSKASWKRTTFNVGPQEADSSDTVKLTGSLTSRSPSGLTILIFGNYYVASCS